VAAIGRGVPEGFLSSEEVSAIAREGLARLDIDGRRVLVLIPDGTRTMPMPLVFDVLEREIGPRAAALDFLVALGTHSPMSDADLGRLVGRTTDADGLIGGGGDLGLDTAQPADHVLRFVAVDRCEVVPIQPPGKRLRPGDLGCFRHDVASGDQPARKTSSSRSCGRA